MTLPLIDAFFFNDDRFAADLKSALHLTDDQVAATARHGLAKETALLREKRDQELSDDQSSTTAAAMLAHQRMTEIVGAEKANDLSDFVLRRWREGPTTMAGGCYTFARSGCFTDGASTASSNCAIPCAAGHAHRRQRRRLPDGCF